MAESKEMNIMTTSASVWEPCTLTVHALTQRGESITVESVPGERNRETGEEFYDPADMSRVYLEKLAGSLGLDQARDLATLLMLGAPAYGAEATHVPYIYHLNKMLFYQAKKLEKEGLDAAFPHDVFVAERKGPVPSNLKTDLARLESQGLIKCDWPTGKEHQPVPVHLTKTGRRIAKELMDAADPWIMEATEAVKTELILMEPQPLMDKVHAEYPELQRQFVELDAS